MFLYFLEEQSSEKMPVIGWVIIGIFAVIILALLFSQISGAIKYKNADHTIDTDWLKKVEDDDFGDDEMHEYICHIYGQANNSLLFETMNREHIFELNKRYITLFGAEEYDFINHITGRKTVHKVGKTVTVTSGTEHVRRTDKSYFDFDGVMIWDYLANNGVFLECQLTGLMVGAFNVIKNGKQIGRIEYSNPRVFEKGHTSSMVYKGYYKVMCRNENLDVMAVAALAVDKTDVSAQSNVTF